MIAGAVAMTPRGSRREAGWAGVEVAASAALPRHEAAIDRHNTRQSSSRVGRRRGPVGLNPQSPDPRHSGSADRRGDREPFAVGRTAVSIVSDKRMYRLSADRTGRPHIDREMSYRNPGIPTPSQVDAGSGATPTIPPRRLGRDHRQRRPDGRGRVPHRDAAAPPSAPRRLPGAGGRQERKRQRELTIRSGRSLSVENNHGYQDPFGPHTGAITRPGFARMDINTHINGCGLV